MTDVNRLISDLDPDKHPNAFRLIMDSMSDALHLGPEEAIRRRKVLRSRTELEPYADLVYEIQPAEHHRAIIEFLENPEITRGVVVAPPGSAKCQPGSTLVSMVDGTLRPLREVQLGDEVRSIDTDGLKHADGVVTNKIHSGAKNVLRVTTKSGYTTTLTPDHRIFTFDGWKEMRDVVVGDFLAAPRDLPEPEHTEPLPDGHAELLAYWIAEGARDKQQACVAIAQQDEALLSDLELVAGELGYPTSRITHRGEVKGLRLNRGGGSGDGKYHLPHPRELLRSYGLDPAVCGAHDKFVPDSVFRAPNEQVASFLNRLFACDGSVERNHHRTGGVGACISYVSVSRRLVDDVRHLLLRFGITSSVAYNPIRYQGELRPSWKLHITEGRLVHQFMGSIGIHGVKQARYDELAAGTRGAPLNSVSERVPAGWRSLMAKSVHHYRQHHNIRVDKPGGTFRGKVAAVAEIEDNDQLRRLAESDVRWDEVISIESAGQEDTYDIEVGEHHNFFADGLLSHNSTWVSGVFTSSHFSRYPDESILLVSNTLEQATKWTSNVRDIVDQSPEYQEIFPEIQKDEEKGWTRQELFLANRQDRANVSPNLVGYGVGGPILGRRANIIIVDDPTSQSESRSAPQMQAQKEWFKATLMSRLVPGGRVLVVLTRWSEDDLASMLINDMDFHVLHMPALGDPEKGAFADYILPPIYDEEDEPDVEAYLAALQGLKDEHEAKGYECEITRSVSVNRHCLRKYFGYEGDDKQSIWPDRFTVKEYMRVRRDYGTSQFRLIYQGDTSGTSGDTFKSEWFRYWGPDVTTKFEGDDGPIKEIPEDARWYQFVDIATGTNDQNDFFVIATVAIDQRGRVFIVNVERKRLEAPDQPKLIQSQFAAYPLVEWVMIETTGYQLSLFQNLKRQYMIPLKKYTPIKNKQARAESTAALYEAGRIYHKQGAKWLDAFEYELTTFPKGKHDDQVDALTGGMEELASTFVRKPVTIQVGFG